MFDSVHRLWASVVMGLGALGSIVTLLMAGISVTDITTSFMSLGLLLNLYLISEVQKVKQQTNGMATEDRKIMRDLIETVKHSQPIREG